MWDTDSALYVGYISAITSLIDTLPSDKSSSSPNVIFVFSVNLRLWLHWFLPGFERVHVIRRHNRTIMLNLSLSLTLSLFQFFVLHNHVTENSTFNIFESLFMYFIAHPEPCAQMSILRVKFIRCIYISHSRKTEPFVILRHVALTYKESLYEEKSEIPWV